jgi:hypothetical protein
MNTQLTQNLQRRSLFDIGNDLTVLNNLIEEVGGDVSDPLVCAALESWFSQLSEERGQKLDNIHAYIRMLEGEHYACERLRDEWGTRAESRKKRIEGMKAMLVVHLQQHGGKAESASGIKFRVQPNGGKPPLVINDDFDYDDERFFDLVPKIDRDAVREAIDRGETVPGAHIAERGHHLRVS